MPTTIDATGPDASAALKSFIASVPDGSVIVFKAGGIYRMDTGLAILNRHNLVFEGNGATLRANGSSQSAAADPIVILVFGHQRQRHRHPRFHARGQQPPDRRQHL